MNLLYRYRKFLTGIILASTFIIASKSYAAKWETLTFDEDISIGMEKLNHYCIMHNFTIEDILWANATSSQDIKPGTSIYLPKNHADLLAVWQNRGKLNYSASLPINKPKPVNISTPPVSPVLPAAKPAPVTPPAKSDSKPDKILADAQKRAEDPNKIPGLMDPIIILSPNGDPATGPMRLVISGDKVEVVRLPANAAPKRPSLTDLDHTFGTIPDYLQPYFYTPPRRPNDNYVPNLAALNGKMLWPVDGKVTSGFGPRGSRKHAGIDIPMPLNTPIKAARTGVVARTGNNSTPGFRGYGNFVLMDHGGGVKTLYAHCNAVAVREGQRITVGQVVGYVGRTGRASTEHLHFEVRINDKPVNPLPYLATHPQLATRTTRSK
ncbi:MAG: peptidoglycan DD-metalloendopeptidase family protein [Synergistaceae bacterium]|nr:peptidoglycan DD-metalloendopeptidase family protein [Synergistaceae bacterium]